MLLLHTNRAYAKTLAAEVTRCAPSFEVEVVARVPVPDRLRTLVTTDYDLVQTDELMVNGVLATAASLIRRIPLIVAVRGWADYTNAHGQYTPFRQQTIELRTRIGLWRAAETIFISETARKHLESFYSVDSSTVIGRPIDVSKYGSGSRTDRDTFDVLTVTNLRYEGKFEGVKIVLDALDPLFDRYPDLRYRIAGGGQYRRDLEAFLDGYEHADRVSVLGFVDRVEDEFASADAFVYVSFLDAYPTVVLEAQAAELPVIGGDAVGVPEVVGDGGIICAPTPDGVRSTIDRIISDDDFRTELIQRSTQRMQTYNEECARGHVEVWDRVLSD